MKTHTNRSSAGFTLVELLVVVVIIAALTALSFLGYSRMRGAGDRATTVAIMRQLQMANYSYAAEHGGQFVPIEGRDENSGNVDVTWHQNSLFLAYLTSDQTALVNNQKTNDNPPPSILDPIVLRGKKRLYSKLFASYGYNQENMPSIGTRKEKGFMTSQITNGARSAAFVTGTDHYLKYSGRFLWTSTSVEGKSMDGRMAFRHGGKAIVAYYDGSTGFVTQGELRSFDKAGGISHPFWKANY